MLAPVYFVALLGNLDWIVFFVGAIGLLLSLALTLSTYFVNRRGAGERGHAKTRVRLHRAERRFQKARIDFEFALAEYRTAEERLSRKGHTTSAEVHRSRARRRLLFAERRFEQARVDVEFAQREEAEASWLAAQGREIQGNETAEYEAAASLLRTQSESLEKAIAAVEGLTAEREALHAARADKSAIAPPTDDPYANPPTPGGRHNAPEGRGSVSTGADAPSGRVIAGVGGTSTGTMLVGGGLLAGPETTIGKILLLLSPATSILAGSLFFYLHMSINRWLEDREAAGPARRSSARLTILTSQSQTKRSFDAC